MKNLLAGISLLALFLAGPSLAQTIPIGPGASGGGGLNVGSAPVLGTCTNGYLLYNNAGVLGCQAASAASLAIGSPITGATNGYGLYVNASTQLGQFAYGTGVFTALGVNIGSAGAPVLFNGALGTPSSGTLTSATGLPISTGVSGLGTGVATALGNNTNATGGFPTVGTSGTNAGLLNGTNTYTGFQTFTTSDVGLSDGSGGTTTFARGVNGNNYTLSLPSITDTVVTLSAAQTLGSKTLNSPAVSGTITGTATWTGTQTLNGSSSTFAAILANAAEPATVSATAATGTINYYLNSQSVLYYTTNASANWTVNFAFSAGTTLNSALAVGQAATAVFLVAQGATAYYNSAVTIDGVSVTPLWQGGTTPAAGDASSTDIYTYTIIKTASTPTYTVLASQVQFK